jgi:hypothetical protein
MGEGGMGVRDQYLAKLLLLTRELPEWLGYVQVVPYQLQIMVLFMQVLKVGMVASARAAGPEAVEEGGGGQMGLPEEAGTAEAAPTTARPDKQVLTHNQG